MPVTSIAERCRRIKPLIGNTKYKCFGVLLTGRMQEAQPMTQADRDRLVALKKATKIFDCATRSEAEGLRLSARAS